MESLKPGVMQETLLLHALSTGDISTSLRQHVCVVDGDHDILAVQNACRKVIEEQPSLRSKLVASAEGFEIVPLDTQETPVTVFDFRHIPENEREQRTEELLIDDRQRGFDNDTPLCRFGLLQLDSAVIILLSVSNIVLDHPSTSIIFNRLLAFLNNPGLVAADPEGVWNMIQTRFSEQSRQCDDRHEAFWRSYLVGVEMLSYLPFRPAPGAAGLDTAGRLSKRLTSETSNALRQLASAHNLSWQSIAECTWAMLMSRCCGKGDILLPVEREFSDKRYQDAAGVFANIVLRRIRVPSTTSVIDWMCSEDSAAPDIVEHGTCSFPHVLDIGGLERGGEWLTCLVRVMAPGIGERLAKYENVSVSSVETVYEVPGVPLLATVEIGTRISLTLVTDRRKIDDPTALQLLSQWQELLSDIGRSPDTAVGEFLALSERDYNLTVQKWNETEAPYPADKCIHQLFVEQANSYPERPAISMGNESLSYKELDFYSDCIAAILSESGVTTNDCVAICLPRSLELPAAVVGVLKAGAAYLPIDPAYPRERIDYMLEDSGAKIIITNQELSGLLENVSTPLFNLENVRLLPDKTNKAAIPDGNDSPEQPAYILYTSGSTGRPKGVAMPHRALVNLIAWQQKVSSELPDGARTLQFSALSFDVSFQELFATLCSGQELVLISEEMRLNPSALWDSIAKHKVNRIFLPFVALQQLAEAAADMDSLPQSLLEVITAGEQLQITEQVVQMFQRLPDATLHNQYGPTETHVVTSLTLSGSPSEWDLLPTIGRPIANARCYLLDSHQKPVPVGVAGEIYIGGHALALGYLNRLELTKDRFLPDPFSPTKDARMYRTGDLGRFRPDGAIEYLGRADDQVKIRGYRVELAEVEAALRKLEDIENCAVTVWKHQRENRLVAYVTVSGNGAFDEGRAREFMNLRVPDYMCPSLYVVIDKLPLTPSGKLNRRALPEPQLQRASLSVSFETARNKTEQEIIEVWQEFLGIDQIGRNDRFFDLGGTSLLMVRIHRRLEQRFNRKFPITTLFQYSTVASLAGRLEESEQTDSIRQHEIAHRAAQQRKAMMRRQSVKTESS